LAVASIATGAAAGGIDRSGQGIGIIFEDSNYVELSFGTVSPDISGVDEVAFGSSPIANVAPDYTQLSLGLKVQVNEKNAISLIVDQPFGAKLDYPTTSVALGSTTVDASSTAVTAILRHQLNDRVSLHGGVRVQTASGMIGLSGAAYGGFSGYNVDLSADTSIGYVIGAAYEIPDIALRVALTYNSAVTHQMDTVEMLGAATIGTGVTEVQTPHSVNIDFQSGVAADTLVFGSIRWAEWSTFLLEPATFTVMSGSGLIDLDDVWTYKLGVGRKFSDTWSGAVSVTYEPAGDDLVSPLSPTNGRLGATLAGIYTSGHMKISTGINYTKIGDANPETGTPDTSRAILTGNSVWGVGVKIGYSF